MNTGHTPGPYRYEALDDTNAWIMDERGRYLFEEVAGDEEGRFVADTAERTATGRLLAQAPALLDSCRELAAFLDGAGPPEARSIVKAAKVRIAAALGAEDPEACIARQRSPHDWVCAECGSRNVEWLDWVDSNTGESTGTYESDDSSSTWCRDCQDHNGVRQARDFCDERGQHRGNPCEVCTEEAPTIAPEGAE